MSPFGNAFSAIVLLATLAAACAVPDEDPGPQGSEENEVRAGRRPPRVDPLGCPGGYCEADNRASLTYCRPGFHVNPYAVCSNDGISACCAPIPPAPDAGPSGCFGGYCEADNRGPATVCRPGFHVNVYAVCGLGTDACCRPN